VHSCSLDEVTVYKVLVELYQGYGSGKWLNCCGSGSNLKKEAGSIFHKTWKDVEAEAVKFLWKQKHL